MTKPSVLYKYDNDSCIHIYMYKYCEHVLWKQNDLYNMQLLRQLQLVY